MKRRLLPGFGLTLGYTIFYLSVIVLIPLCLLLLKAGTLTWPQFAEAVANARALAAYRLTLFASLAAALINAVFGFLVAWVLVRYEFPGKSFIDALIDLPFALPTAVSGIALTSIYAPNGWLGAPLEALGIRVAFTTLGIVVALAFIGLPFVVRTLQPALEELDPGMEEAALVLGASAWQSFTRVVLPALFPALLTGFAMAFARALGEYGSVVFISGNMPKQTEIAPLLLMAKLEQFDYAGATAIGLVLLAASFAMLLAINVLQRKARRALGQGAEA